jgi:hypothetical protein
MVVLLTGSKNISAEHVKDKAGKIQRHMRIQRNAKKRFSERMKSAAVCAGWNGLIAGVTQYRDRVDKKKLQSCQP